MDTSVDIRDTERARDNANSRTQSVLALETRQFCVFSDARTGVLGFGAQAGDAGTPVAVFEEHHPPG